MVGVLQAMSLRGQKNSKKQGDIGLGIAIGWFATQGYTVCVPLTDSQDYDLDCNYLIPISEIASRNGLSLNRLCDPFKLSTITL